MSPSGEFRLDFELAGLAVAAAQGAGIADESPGGIILEHDALSKLAPNAGDGTDLNSFVVVAALAFLGPDAWNQDDECGRGQRPDQPSP